MKRRYWPLIVVFALAGILTATAAAAAPRNTAIPTIGGTAREGQTLTAPNRSAQQERSPAIAIEFANSRHQNIPVLPLVVRSQRPKSPAGLEQHAHADVDQSLAIPVHAPPRVAMLDQVDCRIEIESTAQPYLPSRTH